MLLLWKQYPVSTQCVNYYFNLVQAKICSFVIFTQNSYFSQTIMRGPAVIIILVHSTLLQTHPQTPFSPLPISPLSPLSFLGNIWSSVHRARRLGGIFKLQPQLRSKLTSDNNFADSNVWL